MCGIWVADHIVYTSAVGSTTTLRGSMNEGISRCWMYLRSITTSESSSASAIAPPVPASPESKTQV
jgi:hypothetical protein